MEKNKFDNLLLGLVLGFLFPVICFALYAKYRFPEVPLTEIFNHVYKLGIVAAMTSLSVFWNLFLFFFFIWKKADKTAKGILAVTIGYAIFVVIIKLLP